MPSRDSSKNKANTSSPKTSSTDAIQMLREDHRKVEKLFDEFQQADGEEKQQIAQQIFHEIEVHSTLEEEMFYPALENQGDSQETTSRGQDQELDGEAIMHTTEPDEAREPEAELNEESEIQEEGAEDLVATAFDEHRVVRDMIDQLKQRDASTSEFQQGMEELQKSVADHVSTEEGVIFSQAQLTLDTKRLGKQMQQRKQEILAAAA